MSNFSTVLDNLYTALAAMPELSGKTFIPNPYSIPDNNETFLRDGYGVVVGTATQGLNEFKSTWAEQDVGIVIARQVLRTDSNHDPIKDAIKAIRDDGVAVRQRLLGDTGIVGCDRINYVSTDGFTFEEDIIYATVNFTFTLIDNL